MEQGRRNRRDIETDGTTVDVSRRDLLVMAGAAMLSFTATPAAARFPALAPAGNASVDHARFDRLLQRYVKPDAARYNRVDYANLKREGTAELKAYLAALSSIDPRSLGRDEAHAFWINLYNAKTLEVVIDRYPVSSIRDIRLGGGGLFKTGPWSRKIMTVNGTELSLDDVEHEIVRAQFRDPLSHYGLNCASYSCPNLMTRAYTGSNIAALLAQSAREYVNHPRGLSVNDGQITASRIYSWYADDFGGTARLKAHWKAYAAPELSQRIESAAIGSYVYDWSLNDV